MDKLSSILPSNSRVTSVDLEGGPPLRPGAPGFGRAEGKNSIKDKVSLSPEAKDMALKNSMLGRRGDPKEISRTKAVEEINRKFFDTRLNKPVIEEVRMEAPKSENVSDDALDLDVSSLKDQISQYETNPEPAAPRLNIEA